jgi:hypothetical protein
VSAGRQHVRSALVLAVCSLVGHLCARPAAATLVCGSLVPRSYQGQECLVFYTSTGWLYLLDDYGGFAPGDSVLVFGDILPGSEWICGGYFQTLQVDMIQACRGFDFGCGVLARDEDCRWFHSWQYGDFLLLGWGGFQVGDTVRVYGGLVEVGTWCVAEGCIMPDSVRACSDTLTALSPTTWGRVKALYR